jgi:hypothetical protein
MALSTVAAPSLFEQMVYESESDGSGTLVSFCIKFDPRCPAGPAYLRGSNRGTPIRPVCGLIGWCEKILVTFGYQIIGLAKF